MNIATIQNLGVALRNACDADTTFHQAILAGFNRRTVPLAKPKEGNAALLELGAAMIEVMNQLQRDTATSSQITNHSIDQRSEQRGSESTTASNATSSRRVIPSKSAARSKRLRGKRGAA